MVARISDNEPERSADSGKVLRQLSVTRFFASTPSERKTLYPRPMSPASASYDAFVMRVTKWSRLMAALEQLSEDAVFFILRELAPHHLLSAALVLAPISARAKTVAEASRAVGNAILMVVASHFWDLHCRIGQGTESKAEALLRCVRTCSAQLRNKWKYRLVAPADPVDAARACLARMKESKTFLTLPPLSRHDELIPEKDKAHQGVVNLRMIHHVLFPSWHVRARAAWRFGAALARHQERQDNRFGASGGHPRHSRRPGPEILLPSFPPESVAVACMLGSSEVVNFFFSNKIILYKDVQALRFCRRHPIVWAARSGNIELIKILLDLEEQDLVAENNGGPGPAPLDSVEEDSEIDDEDCDPDEGEQYYFPPGRIHRIQEALEMACHGSGNLELVRLLIERARTLGICFGHCRACLGRPRGEPNALGVACMNGNLELVKMLLASGLVDLQAQERIGDSPLVLAIENRQAEMIDYLLNVCKADANADSHSARRRSTLLAAAYNGDVKLTELLLDRGATVKEPGWALQDYPMQSIHDLLVHAVSDKARSVFSPGSLPRLVELLIERGGASCGDYLNPIGHTIWRRVAQCSDSDAIAITEYFISKGVSLVDPRTSGSNQLKLTPLQYACRTLNRELIQYWLDDEAQAVLAGSPPLAMFCGSCENKGCAWC